MQFYKYYFPVNFLLFYCFILFSAIYSLYLRQIWTLLYCTIMKVFKKSNVCTSLLWTFYTYKKKQQIWILNLENKLKKRKIYIKSIFVQDILVGIWYSAPSKGKKNLFNTTIIYFFYVFKWIFFYCHRS